MLFNIQYSKNHEILITPNIIQSPDIAILLKHQVAISNDTFNRVERIARIFGEAGYSVGNFVEHIINEHLDNNSANYESWFTLISKSF